MKPEEQISAAQFADLLSNLRQHGLTICAQLECTEVFKPKTSDTVQYCEYCWEDVLRSEPDELSSQDLDMLERVYEERKLRQFLGET